MKIFSNARLPPDAAVSLSSQLAFTGHELVKEAHEAEVIFGQPNIGHVELAPRLRWIHLASGGHEHLEEWGALLRLKKITLSCSGEVYAEPCAEYVITRMLEDARTQAWGMAWSTWSNFARTSPWELYERALPENRPRLLYDQRVVVVGYGNIGQLLVNILLAFKMNVTVVRRAALGYEQVKTLGSCDPASGIVLPPDHERQADICEALSEADHVVNVLPGGVSTRLWFNHERLHGMKEGSAFYNVGRGSTVDHQALAVELKRGHIRAAYLDVTDPEPLPPGHPLPSHPSCHITPHVAGNHRDEPARLVDFFLFCLKQFEVGGAIPGKVDY